MRERETERGNEGVCLGEKLTIGGQNSPGLPKSLSLLTITICKQIGQEFEGFCPVVLVVGQKFARSLQKKKQSALYYINHFLLHSFLGFV